MLEAESWQYLIAVNATGPWTGQICEVENRAPKK